SPVHAWRGGMRSRPQTALPAECLLACPRGTLVVCSRHSFARGSERLTQHRHLPTWIFAGFLAGNVARVKCPPSAPPRCPPAAGLLATLPGGRHTARRGLVSSDVGASCKLPDSSGGL